MRAWIKSQPETAILETICNSFFSTVYCYIQWSCTGLHYYQCCCSCLLYQRDPLTKNVQSGCYPCYICWPVSSSYIFVRAESWVYMCLTSVTFMAELSRLNIIVPCSNFQDSLLCSGGSTNCTCCFEPNKGVEWSKSQFAWSVSVLI